MRLSLKLIYKENQSAHLDTKQGKVYIQTHYSVALSAFVYRECKNAHFPGPHRARMVIYAPRRSFKGLLFNDLHFPPLRFIVKGLAIFIPSGHKNTVR